MTDLLHRIADDHNWDALALATTFTLGLALTVLAYTARSKK